MSPRPGGDVTNSSEFAVMGSGEWRAQQERRESARTAAWRFVRERPGLALILAYLAVTVVARFDDVWFYQLFRINLFYYSDPEDILLAPLRNLVVWIFFLAPALILLLISWLANREPAASAEDVPRDRGLFDRKWNTPALRFGIAAVVVVVSAAAMARLHAERRSDDVRAGIGRVVTLTRTDGVNVSEQPLLLGSGGNFFFLYYPKRKKTEIVPMENTALMTIDLQRNESSARVKARNKGDS